MTDMITLVVVEFILIKTMYLCHALMCSYLDMLVVGTHSGWRGFFKKRRRSKQGGQVLRVRARKIDFCPFCDPEMFQQTHDKPTRGSVCVVTVPKCVSFFRSSPFKQGDY